VWAAMIGNNTVVIPLYNDSTRLCALTARGRLYAAVVPASASRSL